MAIATSMTNYTGAFGGASGFINIGGWNTTLTDVSTQPKEIPGAIRFEGANEYIYAMAGSSYVAGTFLRLATAAADGYSALIAPVVLTQMSIGSSTDVGNFFAIAVAACTATQYGWHLRRGIYRGNLETDASSPGGMFIVPSTNTANLWMLSTTSTAAGFAAQAAATGVASAAGAGIAIMVDLRGIRGK